MCHKIAFLTGSRSDFGLIQSIIRASKNDVRFSPILIRIGHSLISDDDYVGGQNKIETYKVETDYGISEVKDQHEVLLSISEIIKKSSQLFNDIRPDIVFAPGDRFEMFGLVVSSYYQRIPIAHIFGGDRSIGGHLDDNIRHTITKLSSLHFTVCDSSKERVLRLGEENDRVYNFGSPVVDNLINISDKRPVKDKYAILTYHTITGYPEQSYGDIIELLSAVAKSGILVFITSTNNELGSLDIMRGITESVKKYPSLIYVDNLGWEKYLNYLKFAEFSIGNSSSNLLEAPILQTPSINVGARQKGRFSPDSVMHVECEYRSIINAIKVVLSENYKSQIGAHPYGTGNVGMKVLDSIDCWIHRGDLLSKKITY